MGAPAVAVAAQTHGNADGFRRQTWITILSILALGAPPCVGTGVGRAWLSERQSFTTKRVVPRGVGRLLRGSSGGAGGGVGGASVCDLVVPAMEYVHIGQRDSIVERDGNMFFVSAAAGVEVGEDVRGAAILSAICVAFKHVRRVRHDLLCSTNPLAAAAMTSKTGGFYPLCCILHGSINKGQWIPPIPCRTFCAGLLRVC